MKRSRTGYLVAGGVLILLLLLVALLADWITPVSPYYADAKTSVMQGVAPFPPLQETGNLLEAKHLLGTDQYGRDVWTRLAYGTRWSLLFAALIMLARMALAVPIAFLAAFGPRFVSWMVGRLYVFTSAIPPLIIYMLLLSSDGLRTAGLWRVAAITVTLLALMEWPRIAVTLKGRIEQLLTEPFVEGAVAAGATKGRIFRRHLIPHLWPTLLQLLSAEMSRAMLVIAQLGLFGILVGGGIISIIGDKTQIVTTGIPEWGGLISDGRIFIRRAPWIAFSPAMAFLVAVVGFNLFSQGLEGTNLSLAMWVGKTKERLTPRVWYAALVTAALLVLTGGYAVGKHQWTQSRTELSTVRGYHVDVKTRWSINDPDPNAVAWRWLVQQTGNAADIAYESVAPLFPPAEVKQKPVLRLYETRDGFEQATGAAGNTWYRGDGIIHVSPDLLNGITKWELRRSLVRELVRYLTDVQLQQPNLDPLVFGRVERQSTESPDYKVDVYGLAGSRMKTLPGLYATPVLNLSQSELRAYAAQAAILDELIQRSFPGVVVDPRQAHTLQDLAAAVGQSGTDLSDKYLTNLLEKILDENIADNPAVRERIPGELLAGFAVWRAEAAPAGYEAVMLDTRVNGSTAKVYLAEWTVESGRIKALAIAVQDWALVNNSWKVASGTELRPKP